MVLCQVVIGTFTNQPLWFSRINPFIHVTILYSFLFYAESNLELIQAQQIFSAAFTYILLLVYVHYAFKTMLKVVDQSIEKELNSHRQISAIFNSL